MRAVMASVKGLSGIGHGSGRELLGPAWTAQDAVLCYRLPCHAPVSPPNSLPVQMGAPWGRAACRCLCSPRSGHPGGNAGLVPCKAPPSTSAWTWGSQPLLPFSTPCPGHPRPCSSPPEPLCPPQYHTGAVKELFLAEALGLWALQPSCRAQHRAPWHRLGQMHGRCPGTPVRAGGCLGRAASPCSQVEKGLQPASPPQGPAQAPALGSLLWALPSPGAASAWSTLTAAARRGLDFGVFSLQTGTEPHPPGAPSLAAGTSGAGRTPSSRALAPGSGGGWVQEDRGPSAIGAVQAQNKHTIPAPRCCSCPRRRYTLRF
ncbi:uncharacterized protein LOC112551394 [Alligator sinensis]|uniref:Uncharacterized protein LOC112551394 n=1 Tax=Alligator sinensis TaxID=38654 RepID=A0A3Q0H7N5_ALLSI|nr:uncharacterized protein LOC112551394 [Alligator sinensis]